MQLPALAAGVELLGEYAGSGYREAPYLVRRADGGMLEISPLLQLVASKLDGSGSLTDLAQVITAELGRPVSATSVAFLIDHKLRPLKIVGPPPTAGNDVPPDPGSPALGLTVRAGVVPAPAVRAAATALRPLFLPPVVAAALLGFAAGDAWLLTRRHAWAQLHHTVVTPALFIVVVGVTLAAGVLHEIGHATASRYGGAEPGAIGVGIYLLWPVFYNDLNDSYRLDRWGRLRADLGGVYFNVLAILVLSATYAWAAWPPLLAAIATQHVAVAQQFLPFVRLDGYYVVSDLAGVPDLFGRIRPILASVLPGVRPGPQVSDLRPRARAVVTVWVVLTVPVLLAAAALLVTTMPSMATAGWTVLRVDARTAVTSLAAGAYASAAARALRVLGVSVPFVGLTAMVLRAIVGRRLRARQSPGEPVELPPVDSPGTGRRPLGPGGTLVLLYLLATSAALRPRPPKWRPTARPPSSGRSRRRPPGGNAGDRPRSPHRAAGPGWPTG